MDFTQPFALLIALAAVPAVVALAWRRRATIVLPSLTGLPTARRSLRLGFAKWLLPALLGASILAFAVAAAGPREGKANAVIPAEGIDIVLVVDTSSSMSTSFGAGRKSRLEGTRDVVREFIKGRENDRIGLVIFSQSALPLTPPTLDYRSLDTMVAAIESGVLPDGTAIGVGLAEGVNMLRESTAASRVAILLTDGQQNEPTISPEEAAELASALRIRVYTIAVVSPTRSGTTQEVDEKLLRAVADRTGGRYFAATSPESLAEVYEEIARLETSGVGREHFQRFTELGPWFALGGAGLLAAYIALSSSWLRRSP